MRIIGLFILVTSNVFSQMTVSVPSLLEKTVASKQEITIECLSKDEILVGDEFEFYALLTAKGDKDVYSPYLQLRETQFNPNIYILSSTINGNKVKSQAVLTNKTTPDDLSYQIINIDCQFKKSDVENANELDVLSFRSLPESGKSYWLLITIGILLILCGAWFFWCRYQRKKKVSKVESEIRKISTPETRGRVEMFFQNIKENQSFEYNTKVFSDFKYKLDSIQYKEKWSDEELLEIKKLYEQLFKTLKVKDGI